MKYSFLHFQEDVKETLGIFYFKFTLRNFSFKFTQGNFFRQNTVGNFSQVLGYLPIMLGNAPSKGNIMQNNRQG